MGGRTVGRSARSGALLGVALVLSVGPAVLPCDAQVGFDPAKSPYKDLRRSSGVSVMTGWIMGDRGRLKIGHSNGRTYSISFEVPVGSGISLQPTVSYAETERYVIDPFKNVDERVSGPVPDDMMLIDLGVRFLLTGNKTWHGLTAYASGAIGMASSMSGPRDRGNYELGRKLTLNGGLGLRFLPLRRLSLYGDARITMWRLSYPPDYYRPASPDNIPVLFPNDSDSDWTIHPWVSFGLGLNL